MGKEKAGFLSPKAIANRIKSKGLQKLRWFCQMCQKQCRDENGYKCHTMSEAHHRQMKLFMEDGGKFISSFSSEFLKGYLDIVRRQFGGKRVHSNVVYQEYIKDKEHVHMNATRWHTLTGLCMWLGKQGICKADETEKGWFIEYIDRDPEKMKRKEFNERLEKTEDEVNRNFLEKQIEHNLLHAPSTLEGPSYTPLVRENEEEPIKLNMSLTAAKASEKPEAKFASDLKTVPDDAPKVEAPKPMLLKKDKKVNPLRAAELKAKAEKEKIKQLAIPDRSDSSLSTTPQVTATGPFSAISSTHAYKLSSGASASSSRAGATTTSSRKRGVLDDLMIEEEAFKEKKNRRDFWLVQGIEVKLINDQLPDELLLRHAIVLRVVEKYTGVVRVIRDGTKIKVDQDHVETVIPGLGQVVYVVNGAYRGELAKLLAVNKAGYCDVCIDSGLCRGRRVNKIMLEDVCKFPKD